MNKIVLPKNSTDPFITLLIYSDRGAMIAVENIVEIQIYVGSTESSDLDSLFNESKISLRPGHVPYGAEILPGTLIARTKDTIDVWGVITHFGGVITMVDNVCELHSPNINTDFPAEAFKTQSLEIENLYSWVWFNHWVRFIDRWGESLSKQGIIEDSFIEGLKDITPGNADAIKLAVTYMRNKTQLLLRDKSKSDPQLLILKSVARRPYSYTTLDVLKGRENLQNLLERAIENDVEDFSTELQSFDSSKESYDFKIQKPLIA